MTPTNLAATTDFDDVFRRDYQRLVQALTLLCGSREIADDCVQEAFVRAHVRWRRVSRLEDPSGWVRRVAINLARDEERRRRRREKVQPFLARRDHLLRGGSISARSIGQNPRRARRPPRVQPGLEASTRRRRSTSRAMATILTAPRRPPAQRPAIREPQWLRRFLRRRPRPALVPGRPQRRRQGLRRPRCRQGASGPSRWPEAPWCSPGTKAGSRCGPWFPTPVFERTREDQPQEVEIVFGHSVSGVESKLHVKLVAGELVVEE